MFLGKIGHRPLFIWLSNFFLVASIFFLVSYLSRENIFNWIEIKNHSIFLLSVVLILFGFFIESIALKYFLAKTSFPFKLKNIIIASGKFILAKYIPGKIGIWVGKSAYLCTIGGRESAKLFALVFVFQLFTLVSAFFVSVGPVFYFFSSFFEHWIWVLVFIFLGLLIFSQKSVQQFFLLWAGKMLKKEISLSISPKVVLVTIFLLLLQFFCFSLGFYLLIKSVGFEISFAAGFLFPMAAFFGVLVILAPGGIGIREGFITAGLIFLGLSKEAAISVSLLSRVWFLIGEIFFFFFAVILGLLNVRFNGSKNP